MATSTLSGIKEAAGLVEVFLDREREATQGWERAVEYEGARMSELVLRKRVPLPKALFEQYSHLECKSFMGIFPEIHRAWFTVDNRLFLWNYATGSDFYPFEGIDQIITSAAIVEPKPGVFVQDVKYLLAVSTTVEVVLLGVCFSGPSTASEITLIPTQMAVTTDNVAMLRMVSSRSRRLFMAGRDGCLHELTYQGDLNSFWSFGSRKARRLNHSRTALSSLVPGSVKLLLLGDDPLVDLAVDNSREMLYALSECGNITVYDISKQSRAAKVAAADCVADAKRYSPASNARERAFLKLEVVSPQTSSSVYLVVITTLGERIYYGLKSARGSIRSLAAVGFRGIPPLNSDAFRPSVHTCSWIRGALFLADARNGDTDTLVAVYPEKAVPSKSADRYRFTSAPAPTEIVAETPLDHYGGFAKAWSIVEASRPDKAAVGHRESGLPKEVIVLTNSAIQLYARIEPRDQLESLLASSTVTGEDRVQKFFQHYGAVESCSMCLAIAADWGPDSSSNSDVITAATRSFFANGGEPSFDDLDRDLVPYGSRAATQFDVGRPSASPPPLRFSASHDGLCLHFARVVAPVWWKHVTTSRKVEDIQYLNLAKEELVYVREMLLSTVEFLRHNASSLAPRRGDSQQQQSDRKPTAQNSSIQDRLYKGLLPRRRAEDAVRLEQISIENLTALAEKVAEALSLLSLLSDHQFQRLADQLSPVDKQELVRLRFCELVVSETGALVCNALLEALFATYAEQPNVTNAISEVLQERSHSFFGEAEAALNRGLSLIKQATKKSGPEAASLAAEGVRDAKPFAGRIVNLPAVCNDLRTAGAVGSMAEIIAAVAAAADSNGDAALLDVASKCACDVLESEVLTDDPSKDAVRDVVMRTFLDTPSNAFATRLLRFLIRVGPAGAQELFKYPSTRVEKFLEEEDMSMLWRYLSKQGRHVDAAVVLAMLAEDTAHEATLNERVSCLASAVHNAKVALANNSDARAASLLREVSDKLDVAQVQLRTLEELKRRRGGDVDAPKAVDELSSTLLNLSALYNSYARPWELWESELDALRCASYRDDELVKRLWTDIVDAELATSSSSPTVLQARMASLGRDFHPSATSFPVPFLTQLLEQRTVARRKMPGWAARSGWVAATMIEIGVPRRDVVAAYGALLDSGELLSDHTWDTGVSLYLIDVITQVLSEWTIVAAKSDTARRGLAAASSEVGKVISVCRGLLRTLTDPGAAATVKQLESIEAKVDKLSS